MYTLKEVSGMFMGFGGLVNSQAANAVHKMNAKNIPAVEKMKRRRRPTFSTKRAAMLATTKL